MYCETKSLLKHKLPDFVKEDNTPVFTLQALLQTGDFTKIWNCEKGNMMYTVEKKCSTW